VQLSLKLRNSAWTRAPLLVACLTCLAGLASAQDAGRPPARDAAPAPAVPAKPTKPAAAAPSAHAKTPAATSDGKPHPSRYHPDRFAGRAGKYYELHWGVDSLGVKLVESGELVRFSYRVLDPSRSRVLNDKRNDASLIDPKAGVSLVVPTMEKVGQLRQSATPEAGRSYWMTFSNKGRRVARGDRVDVVIGTFRASNLVVD
jgi:hypothetical protein